MYILIAIILVIAALVCIFVPDPLPMIDEIILVAGSLFTFVKGISDSKKTKSPQEYIKAESKKNESSDSEGDSDSVYVYKPPKSKSKTPKGYPKYDKNNPDAVYYYKKD